MAQAGSSGSLPAQGRADSAPTLIGQKLGAYRVQSLLGTGGMGQVYVAEHELIGRKAAIKVLDAEISGHEDLVSRFFQEARAVNDIRHPNIVEVTDFGTFGNQPFIVMELLEGETLEGRLERTKFLDEVTAARVAAQVSSAVGAAHERGLVHRDLKPANIFLRNHPDYPDFVKVLDFGIAKLMGGASDAAAVKHKTESGSVIGTPAYMSPEQCLGDLSLDHRSDVYSLGVVLYLMVTGRLPFDGESVGRLIVSHVQDAPLAPSAVNPRVSSAMNAVVLRAMAKKPADRFPDMRAFKDALTEAAATGGARAPGPSPFVTPAMPRSVPSTTTVTPMAAAAPSGSPETLRRKLTDIVLGRIESGALELPALSARTLRCFDMVRSPGFSFGGLATVLSEDPRLASQLFQIANTVAVSTRTPATTLEQAIGRLGGEGVRSALVEISARPVIEQREKRLDEAFRRPWHHALAVAMIAERLVEQRTEGRPASAATIDPDEAFRGGLLHDAGRPVVAALLLEIERQMSTVRGRRWLQQDLWLRCIEETHMSAGAALARAWQLPAVADAIGASTVVEAPAGWTLAGVLCLADALAAQEGFALRPEHTTRAPSAIAAARARLGVDERSAARAVQGIKDRVLRRA